MDIRSAITGQNLPKSETEILLAWAIRKPRSYIVAHPEHVLSADELTRFADATARRRRDEPVQHITGTQEFYGRSFKTDGRALVPRGSTEELVRIALEFLKDGCDLIEEIDTDVVAAAKKLGDLNDVKTVIDIGTGTGVIAVTLALERPDLTIIATDVSADALSLAKENAQSHGATIEFRQGSCLDPVQNITEPFVIVSNPPYIPRNRSLTKDVINYEPHVALFGGDEGGEIARMIAEQATKHPYCRGYVIECMKGQLR